ncbi:ankyrin repeat domain-containing protein 50 [Biomphalaria glabrata]|nr:ankyrin repeat domain-containing protein 50-like [Biomphalaria glabrata]
MAEDQAQFDDSILSEDTASGLSPNIIRLMRLCGHNTTPYSSHALNEAVHQACRLGHADLLPFLLQDGARLELRDANGNTPLLISSASGFPSIVGKLLSMGADVNAKNNNGDTALMLATSMEVVRCLLGDTRLHLDEQNSTGNTALMSAISALHLQKVQLLINAGANPETDKLNNSGESALVIAQQRGLRKLLGLLYRAYLLKVIPLHLADAETCMTLLKYNLSEWKDFLKLRPDVVRRVVQQSIDVSTSDVAFLPEFSRLGIDVSSVQQCRMSPIQHMIHTGSCEQAETLLANGAEVTHDDLVLAVQEKQVQIIPLLINHKAPVNKYDRLCRFTFKDSALHLALRNSMLDTAGFLVNHGAVLDPECAVFEALWDRKVETLRFLLKDCAATTKAVVQKPETLIEAVQKGDIQLIQLLLDAGADIDGVYRKRTPLMSTMRIEVINFLLSKGANVNFKTNTTPLINAISWDYTTNMLSIFSRKLSSEEIIENILLVLETLLTNGANLEGTDDHGRTALIASVQTKLSLEVLKYLLNKGANVNHSDNNGWTALNLAAKTHNLAFSHLLLKHSADVDLKTYSGHTPLHNAIGNSHLAELLLVYRANVNARDESGDTPLLLVSNYTCGLEQIAKLLIDHGADLNIRNNAGMSALDLATEKFNTRLMCLLIDSKADLGRDDMQRKSILSILLSHETPTKNVQKTAAYLLDQGISADLVRRDIIQRLIEAGNDGILIQKLIKSGVTPMDIVITISGWPETLVSPLAVSLVLDSLDFASYFFDNWYLTKSDVQLIFRNKNIFNYLQKRKAKTLSYLEKVSRQPLRLELLCFITVSSALGSDQGRRQRILSSKLPAVVQNQLMFSKLEHKVLKPVSADALIICYELFIKEVIIKLRTSPDLS